MGNSQEPAPPHPGPLPKGEGDEPRARGIHHSESDDYTERNFRPLGAFFNSAARDQGLAPPGY